MIKIPAAIANNLLFAYEGVTADIPQVDKEFSIRIDFEPFESLGK